VIDLTSEPQPTHAITMVGDVPVPIDVPPIELPAPPPVPIPHVHNPIPYIVHGAEAAWSDVSSWVSDRFHNLLNLGGDVVGVTFHDVQNMVDVALSVEQTAWASFISTLEEWIRTSIATVESTISDLTSFTLGELLQVWMGLFNSIDAVVQMVLADVYGIDQALAKQWWDTVHGIEWATASVEAWAIDNIAWPILQEISTEVNRIEKEIGADVRALEREIAGLKVGDIAGLGARLAAIAAAVAAVTTWVEECGAPMCEQMGPKTDWSKLLKVLNVAGMLALLTSAGTLTEAQLEQLATTVAGLGANPAEHFVSLFVTEGDTLARAIADSLPSIGL
jgi:hypothetical protein